MERPKLLTQAFIDDLCDWMADSKSVRAYCRVNPEYKPSSICRWLAEFSDFAEQYARAINMRADAKFEKIDDVIEDMRSGIIDATMARVEIDAIRWQSGKMNSKKYGDKVQQEHSGSVSLSGILGEIDGRTSSLPTTEE